MTRYHRKWDRRERLLRAVVRLLKEAQIDLGTNPSVPDFKMYERIKCMINRVERELNRG